MPAPEIRPASSSERSNTSPLVANSCLAGPGSAKRGFGDGKNSTWPTDGGIAR